MKTPPYIVLEGVDGVGKSTVAEALICALREADYPVARLAQPGTVSRAGQLIQDVFAGRAHIEPEAMLWLFATELADLEPKIQAMREDGVAIVCDRHTLFSARVYQAPIHGRRVVREVLSAITVTFPTHVFVLDVPPEVALERQKARKKARNLYDPSKLEEVHRIRVEYRRLVGRASLLTKGIEGGLKLLDGERSVQENVQLIMREIDR